MRYRHSRRAQARSGGVGVVEVESRSRRKECLDFISEQNFGYRNLIVWQKAMLMTQLVYAVVKKFPTDERYALSDQLRRAVVSIASNVAEGCGRASNKDYAHFLAIARGSLYETMTQLEMAQQLGFIPNQLKFVVEGEERMISPFDTCEQLAVEIARMLGSLLKKYGAIVKSKSGVEVEERNYAHQ